MGLVFDKDFLAMFYRHAPTSSDRFDEQIVAVATLADLVPDFRQRFASPRSRDAHEDLLVKLAMARRDEGGIIRPTVAGVLFERHMRRIEIF